MYLVWTEETDDLDHHCWIEKSKKSAIENHVKRHEYEDIDEKDFIEHNDKVIEINHYRSGNKIYARKLLDFEEYDKIYILEIHEDGEGGSMYNFTYIYITHMI